MGQFRWRGRERGPQRPNFGDSAKLGWEPGGERGRRAGCRGVARGEIRTSRGGVSGVGPSMVTM